MSQFGCLIADLNRWKAITAKDRFYVAGETGLWAACLLRLARALWLVRTPLIGPVARLLALLAARVVEVLFGVAIPPSVEIGPGFYIGHIGAITFFAGTRVGRNLSIGPGVVVGPRGPDRNGVPELGDDVYVGSGAKLLGEIRIGHRARIGANAVVLCDVPDDATAVGIPARIRIR